jgi:hypothetical protein
MRYSREYGKIPIFYPLVSFRDVWQFGNETQRDIFVLVLRNGSRNGTRVNSEVWEMYPRERQREREKW